MWKEGEIYPFLLIPLATLEIENEPFLIKFLTAKRWPLLFLLSRIIVTLLFNVCFIFVPLFSGSMFPLLSVTIMKCWHRNTNFFGFPKTFPASIKNSLRTSRDPAPREEWGVWITRYKKAQFYRIYTGNDVKARESPLPLIFQEKSFALRRLIVNS